MKSTNFKLLILAGILSLACTTKVSEWVLMNSAADKYTLIYYHNDIISEQTQLNNKELVNSLKNSNTNFQEVLNTDIKDDYYALYYKNHLISKYDHYNAVNGIDSSPVREQVTNELLQGKLCVLLYLKTGIPEKDEAGLKAIHASVSSSPFGKVISIVELERDNTSEKHLVSMLLNIESDLETIQKPMLFGVFGRFRTLEPLISKGISVENINLMIDYFTADCSCLIKDKLPGISILHKANWENPKPAMVNAIMDANPHLEHQ